MSKTLKERISARIKRSKANVFIQKDFEDLSDYDQRKRALRELINDGEIVRLGRGVYAELRENPLTGQKMLAAQGGFDGAVRQALKKLNVKWLETQTVRDYNVGRTTQIQANCVYVVEGRFRRTLKYKRQEVSFEKASHR